jgi:hypothetical protein
VGPAGRDPRLDVAGKPHLALPQIGGRGREVGAAGKLVDALAAYAAEADTDLVGSHEADRLSHARDYMRETTMNARQELVA